MICITKHTITRNTTSILTLKDIEVLGKEEYFSSEDLSFNTLCRGCLGHETLLDYCILEKTSQRRSTLILSFANRGLEFS